MSTPPKTNFASLLRAAFFGLAVLPRHRSVFIASTLVMALASFISLPDLAEFFAAFDDFIAHTEEMLRSGDTSRIRAAQQRVLDALGRLLDDLIIFQLASAIATAGVLRALVRGQARGGLFGLWLGRDELRILALSVLAGIGAALVAGLASFTSAVLPDELSLLLIIIALAWFYGQMQVVQATTIAHGRMQIAKGLQIGAKQSLPLLGMVMANFIALIIAMVVLNAFIGIEALTSLNTPSPLPDAGTALADATTSNIPLLPRLISALINGLFSALGTFAFSGIGAYAYRRWGDAPGRLV